MKNKKNFKNVEDLVEYAQSKYGVKYQTQFIMKKSNLYIAEINNALMGPLESRLDNCYMTVNFEKNIGNWSIGFRWQIKGRSKYDSSALESKQGEWYF